MFVAECASDDGLDASANDRRATDAERRHGWFEREKL
jgi:hypothetical protein